MSEYPTAPFAEDTRDLSRAEWQRGMGMVVLSHLCDRVIAERAAMSVDEIIASGQTLRPIEKERGDKPYLWVKTYDLARVYFQVPRDFDTLSVPDSAAYNIARHTYEKTLSRTFLEGLKAQRYFPINIAAVIENEATAQSIDGFAMDSTTSFVRLFRRPDFHEVLTTCAFTTNGRWKYMASGPYLDVHSRYDVPGYYGERWFSFSEGTVTLDADLTRFLRKSVTMNNLDAYPSPIYGEQKTLDRRPSSGCPVNHRAPHSSITKEHMPELNALSNALGVEVSTLLRRRETTPIIGMLLGFADFLERVDNEYGPQE